MPIPLDLNVTQADEHAPATHVGETAPTSESAARARHGPGRANAASRARRAVRLRDLREFHALAIATPPPGRFELTTPRIVAAGATALLLIAIVVGPVRHALFDGVYLLSTGRLGQFRQYLLALGAWAPVVSIAIMVVEALVVPAPVAIIMVANGLVFGLWPGMLVSFAGGLLGAVIAYVIGRCLGRALVQRVLPASTLQTADRLMAQYGGWAIFVGRWIPGVPGDPMSYVAGLTRMKVLRFLLWTMAGLLPTNLMTAYVGVHVGGDVPLHDWLFGIAILAIVWISWRVLRYRRHKLHVLVVAVETVNVEVVTLS